MINARLENEEVLYVDDEVIGLGHHDIKHLKELAAKNRRKRIRLCTHASIKDNLHEMFIVLGRDSYIIPHKHVGKVESMSILEGEVDLVFFDDSGKIMRVIEMGDPTSGKLFYHKIVEPVFHMLLIQSAFLVFHEITEGPFIKTDTLYADWAPGELDESFIGRIYKKSRDILE